ncbi:MAG: MTAP family purine nucleoside phosphorylase [Gammaproteobacteria bacterium]|nr:MTAP family purine nucleoside phosphorylase [Gammaproteobacteria bacterium]
MIAIIGGTQMQDIFGGNPIPVEVETPFVEASDSSEQKRIVTVYKFEDDLSFYFLPRHGLDGTTKAHQVDYRAHIWTLRELGVTQVIAGATVGGVDSTLSSSSLLVPDQIIDFTHSRIGSFDGAFGTEEHFDFSYPFTEELRETLLDSASDLDIDVHHGGTYVCCQGPRLETAAEIRFYHQIGASVVGMTLMPEAALARQMELKYAAFNLVVNPAAGVEEGVIDLDSTHEIGHKSDEVLGTWLLDVIGRLQ